MENIRQLEFTGINGSFYNLPNPANKPFYKKWKKYRALPKRELMEIGKKWGFQFSPYSYKNEIILELLFAEFGENSNPGGLE